MTHRVFSDSVGQQMHDYLRDITTGRLVLCARAVTNAGFRVPLNGVAAAAFATLGSQLATDLRSTDTWAFAGFAKGNGLGGHSAAITVLFVCAVGRVDELRADGAAPVHLKLDITLTLQEGDDDDVGHGDADDFRLTV